MTDLKGKIALITGSARGIGKAIAERYGSRGASIVVNYARDQERANETVDSIERVGGRAIAIQADVSKVADIERAVCRHRRALRSFRHRGRECRSRNG